MSQWPTRQSGPLAELESAQKRLKRRKSREPVVHSVEWTTGSQLFRAFEVKSKILCKNM